MNAINAIKLTTDTLSEVKRISHGSVKGAALSFASQRVEFLDHNNEEVSLYTGEWLVVFPTANPLKLVFSESALIATFGIPPHSDISYGNDRVSFDTASFIQIDN